MATTTKTIIKPMLSKRDVLSILPISESTLNRGVAAGTFPAPVRISTRRIAWPSESIEGYTRGDSPLK